MTMLHAIYLEKLGFDIELFYDGPVSPDWKERATSSVPFEILPFGLTLSVKGFQKIEKLVKHLNSFDVTIVHHHICPFLAYYLTKFLKSKLIWYCGEPLRPLWENWLSGMDYKELSCTVKPTANELYGKSLTSIFLSNKLYSYSTSLLRAIDKTTAQNYQTIIANSNYMKKVVERIYSLEKNIPVIHPGVEPSPHALNNYNEELGKYILAVGAMIPMKNYATILNAFCSLPYQLRTKMKLLIIGSGPLEDNIRSQAKELELENVVFRSKVSEQILNNYYLNSSFVVHMALNEPFGLVPVEAALYGKPSIVSNNGGTAEFVIHGKNGLLVNPYSQNDIANAMECLIKDEEFTAEMGSKAKDRAIKEFTIEKSTENLARAIKTL
jgi:glycosyltransferase involved in cell wall biosynthesis